MQYRDFAQQFRAYERLATLDTYGQVQGPDGLYPLLRLRTEGRARLIVTAGFHGEEPAGPLTLLAHMPEVIDCARSRDVGLTVYPCVNPTGFEAATRYNVHGEQPNNDFMRYEVAPGSWCGELNHDQQCLRWRLFDGGPAETRAVREDLARQPAPDAFLDIHQDAHLEGAWTYAYVFGDRDAFRPLMDAAAGHAARAVGYPVEGTPGVDAEGFVAHHDGSVQDWMTRRGVPYTATLETTTATPRAACDAINLIWVRGFIDLAARVLALAEAG